MPQINRAKLMSPLKALKFALPDDTLVGLEGLTKFASRQRLWKRNPDGTLTNIKDGTVLRPDFAQGFFVNDKGEKVGVGFRTFAGLYNYTRILTDPRIRGPFVRIFLWTFAFSALSVLLTFSVGMLISVLLEQPDIRFKRTYRTLLILPYAVPAVLSILILKGLFNQEFGAVNEMLRGIFGFAPEWETNPWGARAMVLLVNIWLGYPYMMLICTGMLQSIPSSIYEASAIDGSNKVVDFFSLTLPLVLPAMIPILISSFAFNFNNFNLIFPVDRWRAADGRRKRWRDRSARELRVQHCLPRFGHQLRAGRRHRHPAFHPDWGPLLDQPEAKRAAGENMKLKPEQKAKLGRVVTHALLISFLVLCWCHISWLCRLHFAGAILRRAACFQTISASSIGNTFWAFPTKR